MIIEGNHSAEKITTMSLTEVWGDNLKLPRVASIQLPTEAGFFIGNGAVAVSGIEIRQRQDPVQLVEATAHL